MIVNKNSKQKRQHNSSSSLRTSSRSPLLLKVALKRRKNKIVRKTTEEQFGYKKSRNAIYMLGNDKGTMYSDAERRAYAASFIGYEKTVVNVRNNKRFRCLEGTGIRRKRLKKIYRIGTGEQCFK